MTTARLRNDRPSPPWPRVGASVPRRGNALTAWLARTALQALGWRIEGTFPDEPRLVIIAAPHRSNFDFVIAMLTLFSLRLRMHWLAKHTLFRGLAGPFMRWLGGIAVDRRAAQDVVGQVVAQMRSVERFALAIAPEGTRQEVDRFKTGFYRIALGADALILPVFVDYAQRRLRLLPPIRPAGDVQAGVAAIEARYQALRAA